MLTVGSLFSGIGGIDLGLERAGMRVIWQAETDPYASKVLAKHWPDVPNLGDVTKIDWENDGLDLGDGGIARSLHVDLVCGGFPCQPVSTAGRRRAQADERWLWPEVARCLRHLRPRWALLENVPGLLVHAMGDVLGDLATLGYDTEWQGVPAAAVGAPHLRWRIFILAHAQRLGSHREADHPRRREPDLAGSGGRREPGRCGAAWARPDVADAPDPRLEGENGEPHRLRLRSPISSRSDHPVGDAEVFAVGPGLCEEGQGGERWRRPRNAGWWAVEPDVGRVAHGIPRRVDRLRCLGNAVVPQVAEYVGRRIMEHVLVIDGEDA